MQITYNPNPLATTVKLDEHEREILWHKVKWQEAEDLLFSAHFHLTDKQFTDVERAKKELDPSYYMKDEGKSDMDKRVDQLTTWYLDELMSMHGGDCICFPCSCPKCQAESIVGVETLAPYPGKYVLSKINSAYSYKDGDTWKQRTLPEALEILKNYGTTVKIKTEAWKNHSQEDYDKHVSKWTAEGKAAYEYLLNYAKEHNML